MSMTSGFLSEPKPGYLAHSRLSAQFASVPTLHDWATFITTLAAPTAEKYTDATEKWGETVRKDQTAYNVAFKTDLPFFEDIARDKERVETFARYMRNQGQSEGLALKHVLDGFDWAGLGNGHVVDVKPTSLPFQAESDSSLDLLKVVKEKLFVADKHLGRRLNWCSRHLSSSASPWTAAYSSRPSRGAFQCGK